jgi:CheY-like chemotaxis protein
VDGAGGWCRCGGSGRAGDVAEDPALTGAFVAVAVCDTGTGMDAAVAGQAFEPFFTTKEPGRGTGLGLAMVRDFARQSGGAVRLASTPTVGTSVELLFPELIAASAADASAPVARVRPSGTESILLVDDEPAVAAFARRALTELGYDVRSAHDVESALRLVDDDPRAIDLLVTDLFLPEGTGTDLADAVGSAGHHDAVRVRVHGRRPRGRRADRGLEMLAKPYNGVELAARVRRILDARPRLQEPAPAD